MFEKKKLKQINEKKIAIYIISRENEYAFMGVI